MTAEIEAVILAGGLGKRMSPLTTELPKSMLPVDGQPILLHIMDGLISSFGSAKVVVATGYKDNKIREAIGDKYGNISIEYVHDPRHLETTRRLLLAQDLLNGPFMVIGSDVIVNPICYERTAQRFHSYSNILGVDTGAVDLTPAPTHALIHTNNDKITYIQMSPPAEVGPSKNIFRDIGLYYFHNNFWHFLRQNPDHNIHIGNVINEGIAKGGDFIIEKYFDRWYHFAYPNDIDVSIHFNT